MSQKRHSGGPRGRRPADAEHWEAVWNRLREQGRVDVENPESTRNPTCRSGSSVLNWASTYLPDPAWGDLENAR